MKTYKEFHGEVPITEICKRLREIVRLEKKNFKIITGYGSSQVGKTAYRLNADGTFDYTGYYEGVGSAWESHGTYTQNGNKITFVYQGNPMVPAGYTVSAPIIDSRSFGSPGDKFVKEG